MKNLTLLICLGTALVSCKAEPKDYVTLSGTITNPNEDMTLTIRRGRDYKKEIKLNEDGSFSDTLKIPEGGEYYLLHNKESGSIYLENGDETSFTLNTDEFDETLKFKGGNAGKSNFYIANYLLNESIFDETASESEENFMNKFTEYETAYTQLKSESNLDSSFYAAEDAKIEEMKKSYLSYIKEKTDLINELSGKPSPSFENYENYAGGTTSLSELAGKYVYVDVWATWCGPCKAEIPSLKKVEEAYKGKNIEFVSISVDEDKDKEAWKTMIKEKEMGGVQLFSDKNWESDFVQAYRIKGIPRFILIGPDGNIVSPDAPRPSDEKLITLFDSLEI